MDSTEPKQAALPICFFVPIDPKGKARARVVRGRAYTPKQTADMENVIGTYCRLAMRASGLAMLKGPVTLGIDFDMPVPPSWRKRQREDALAGRTAHTSKPDVSNMVKLVEDALNGIAYADDSQIVSIKAAKRYAEQGRITVTVWPS